MQLYATLIQESVRIWLALGSEHFIVNDVAGWFSFYLTQFFGPPGVHCVIQNSNQSIQLGTREGFHHRLNGNIVVGRMVWCVLVYIQELG